MSDSTLAVGQSHRFRAVEVPTALPGHCFSCRNHKGPFIDSGIQEDFLGAIYWCIDCVSEMARLFGFITPDQAEALRSQMQTYIEGMEHFQELSDELEAENNGLRRAVARSSNSSSDIQPSADDTLGGQDSENEGSGTSEDDVTFFQASD